METQPGKSTSKGRSLTVNGGALVYTLMIMLLVSMVMSGFLVLNAYYSRTMKLLQDEEVAWQKMQSGMTSYLGNPFALNKSVGIQVFPGEKDFCSLRSERWGLFYLAHAKASYGNDSLNRSALVGEMIPPAQRFSLWLADQNQALTILGNTYLGGLLYLPAQGIRTGFLGDRSFEGEQLFYGRKSGSGKKTPYSPFSSLSGIRSEMEDVLEWNSFSDVYEWSHDHYFFSWKEDAEERKFPGKLVLDEVNLEGKGILKAREIIVKGNCRLEGLQLIAQKIHIQSGFQGSIQVFGTSQILVDSIVSLTYPSVLALCGASSQSPVSLILGENTYVGGMVIFDREVFSSVPQTGDICMAESGVHLDGILFASHNLDLKGSVSGSVLTNGFVHKYSGLSYQNVLIDSYINFESLDLSFLAPCIFNSQKYRIIQWLPDFQYQAIP